MTLILNAAVAGVLGGAARGTDRASLSLTFARPNGANTQPAAPFISNRSSVR